MDFSFERAVEAKAIRNHGVSTAIMKAIQSGLGLTERSAFYVSHTGGFWRMVKLSTSAIANLGPLRSFPRPSPVLTRFGGEKGAWCDFLLHPGTD